MPLRAALAVCGLHLPPLLQHLQRVAVGFPCRGLAHQPGVGATAARQSRPPRVAAPSTVPSFCTCSAASYTVPKVPTTILGDVRILEVKIPYGPPRVQDSLTWVFDCGYEPGCLFNLEDDPTEHVDLSPRHADLAYELAAELAKLNATLFEPVRGTPSLEACLRGIDEGRYYGPWAHVLDGWYTPVPPPSANQRAKDDFLRSTLAHLNKPLPSQLLVKSMYVGVPLMSFNIIFPTIDTCRSKKSCDSRLPFWPCSWPF